LTRGPDAPFSTAMVEPTGGAAQPPKRPYPLVMTTTDQARAAMLEAVRPRPLEAVALAQSQGRTIGVKVTALQDLPPFDASAMDGYAVRRADLGAGPLRVVGESAAGRRFAGALAPAQAVRIFTGAAVPEGADLVVIQEDVLRDGDRVVLSPETTPTHMKANIRRRGIDLAAGAPALAPGRRMDPAAIGLAAAAGAASIEAARAPRAGILCTGSELVSPGAAPGPDQIFESNSPALAALLLAWGAVPIVLRPQADDAVAIAAEVAAQASHLDALVVVGGASVGDHDLAKPALERLGLAMIFNKIAMRPGKPAWYGDLDGVCCLGLPGNPASAFVCAHLFLKPLIETLSGASPGPMTPLRARLACPLRPEGGRESFLRAKLWVGEDAILWADPSLDQDSSLTSVLAAANGCIRRLAGAPAAAEGDIVEAFLFEGRSL